MEPAEEKAIEETPVNAIMHTEFVRVHPDTPIAEISQSFSRWECGDIIVIDDDGRFAGIITRLDLLASITPGMGIRSRKKMGCLECLHQSAANRAAEVMSRSHITIPESATIADALVFMEKIRHPNIIVVNRDGRAVGLIDMCDIIAYLVEKGAI
jgi:predicted transcriptional regulator